MTAATHGPATEGGISAGLTLPELLRRAAREDPTRVFVRFDDADVELTYGELRERSGRLAAGLRAIGVERGDRVALCAGNSPDLLVTYVASTLLGAVVVPIGVALVGASLARVVEKTAPKVAVVAGQGLSAGAALAELGVTVIAGEREEGGPDDAVDFDELLAHGCLSDDQVASVTLADPVAIMFTSGTTGMPKGAVWPHGVITSQARAASRVLGIRPDDVLYTCLPLSHSNAMCTTLAAALLQGATCVVGDGFSASRFWERVERSRATTVNLLGAMAPILMAQPVRPEERRHALRIALVIPTPADREAFESRFGCPVTELYGSTDVSVPIGVPFGERRGGSCGKALPGWTCRIVDELDEEVAVGEVGELVVRPEEPHTVPSQYWDEPQATVEARRNLWLHTGDAMRRDAEGWFYFVDRLTDSIRRFGENVSSHEVEVTLMAHPAVATAAVVAVPSELSEDEVMAVVVPREGSTLEPEELDAFCRGELPHFAVPRYIHLRGDLPRTTTGKVQKAKLRQDGIVPGTWDGGARRRRPEGGVAK
jgi:carnitine-CoA ligase